MIAEISLRSETWPGAILKKGRDKNGKGSSTRYGEPQPRWPLPSPLFVPKQAYMRAPPPDPLDYARMRACQMNHPDLLSGASFTSSFVKPESHVDAVEFSQF